MLNSTLEVRPSLCLWGIITATTNFKSWIRPTRARPKVWHVITGRRKWLDSNFKTYQLLKQFWNRNCINKTPTPNLITSVWLKYCFHFQLHRYQGCNVNVFIQIFSPPKFHNFVTDNHRLNRQRSPNLNIPRWRMLVVNMKAEKWRVLS